MTTDNSRPVLVVQRAIARLRRVGSEERGAVLVVVAGLMFAMLAVAALAIDIGSFYQAQRQAQAAADAGALAGAQDLATNPGSATNDATTYAKQNFSVANVTADSTSTVNQITVNVTAPTPVFFGNFLNLASENVSARAVAGLTTLPGCPNPAAGSSSCDAIFAKDSTCTDSGVSLSTGGLTISGGIWSDGSATVGNGNNIGLSGPLTVGTGTGCAWNGSTGTGLPAGTTPPVPTHATATNWPIDYSLDFPACIDPACTGPGGTPSFCTQPAGTATVSPLSGNIYCDVGTGANVKASDPSTWTGAMNVKVVGGPVAASYVAGSVSIQGSSNPIVEPCGYGATGYTSAACSATVPKPQTTNYPLIYVTQPGSGAATVSGGGGTVIGDLFALQGGISFSGGNNSSIGFLEGQTVTVSGGGLSGDGPLASTSVSQGASVSLLQ